MYLIIMGIILVVIGLVMIIRPDFVFSVTERWKHDGASTPSDFYLANTRFGGVICTLVGTAAIVVYFFI